MTCFDQSHEQAWEAVWLHHTKEAAFIIKRSRFNAPHSDLSAKVSVKQKGTTLKAYPENEDACNAVILHYMINCDKYSNTAKDRGSHEKLWKRMPMLRQSDRSDGDTYIPTGHFVAMEKCIKDVVSGFASQDHRMGIWGIGGDFQTLDGDGGNVKTEQRGDVRTAQIAKDQVNHPKVNGKLQLDRPLMSMEDWKRCMRATINVKDWSVEKTIELQDFMFKRLAETTKSEDRYESVDIDGWFG